jgi:RNA polymerase sigma-70 factor, ECF subfamily
VDLDASFGPHRRALVAHCYRITGSLADAEDAVQDAFVRAWRALPTYEGRGSMHGWLRAIATRTSLDLLERRRPRALPTTLAPAGDPTAPLPPPSAEPLYLDALADDFLADDAPGPEARITGRESVRLAFVAALQVLPPKQRGVLLLKDVVGLSAEETAEVLETTVAAVNSALQRARATLQEQRIPTYDDAPDPALLDRYVRAFESRDPDALVALLADDVAFAMPPLPLWLSGAADVRRFLDVLFAIPEMREQRFVPTRANDAPAFAIFGRDPTTGAWTPRAVHVLHVRDGRVAEIHAFLGPHRGFSIAAPT